MKNLKTIEKRGLWLINALPLLFICILFVAQWPEWWKWIIFERTPMTWMESLLLYSCAIMALGCASLMYINQNSIKSKRWFFLGLVFFYLTLDERFAIHERIRDGFLAPNDINIPLFFWTSSGDYILLLLLALGLFTLPYMITLFKERKIALYCFIFSIVISSIAVVIDSIEVKELSIELQREEQFIEEILETVGMLFFLNSFYLMFFYYLEDIIKVRK